MTVATAESFTSGAVAASITTTPGASRYFVGGIVAYSNEIKTSVLGVSADVIALNGVVSENVALEMARGAQKVLGSDCAIATTGVAGPDGGTDETPVGTVCLAVVGPEFEEVWTSTLNGSREEVVRKSIKEVLERFIFLLD